MKKRPFKEVNDNIDDGAMDVDIDANDSDESGPSTLKQKPVMQERKNNKSASEMYQQVNTCATIPAATYAFPVNSNRAYPQTSGLVYWECGNHYITHVGI